MNANKLAFGENPIVPVLVFADGSEVQGRSFIVHRKAQVIEGETLSLPATRIAGVRAEYFPGKGRRSISASDFSGTPAIVRTHNSLHIEEGENAADQLATDQIDRLAIRFTGRFVVSAANAGEHTFHLINTNDSARLSIDGNIVIAYDDRSYGYNRNDSSSGIFLGPGEHSFELLMSNTGDGTDPGFDIDVRMRTPRGVTQIMDNKILFSVPSKFNALGTSGSDTFVVRYSGNTPNSSVTVSVATDGGSARKLGTFSMSTALNLKGLEGMDSVRVVGSTLNDRIIVNNAGVTVNGSKIRLNSVEKKALAAGAGNDTYRLDTDGSLGAFTLIESGVGVDTIDFSATTTKPVSLNLGSVASQFVNSGLRLTLSSGNAFENLKGGSRNDKLSGNSLANKLVGGRGHDILVGLNGNDQLEGGRGRDVLISGIGRDVLWGGGGDDILITDRTTSDTNLANLTTIRNEWISNRTYSTRIARLRSGIGTTSVSFRAKVNVLKDISADTATGGTGRDWYLKALDDVITDLLTGEQIDNL